MLSYLRPLYTSMLISRRNKVAIFNVIFRDSPKLVLLKGFSHFVKLNFSVVKAF